MSKLVLESVSYGYTNKKMVIENMNYEFIEGNVYAIMGKSGAGKTTLLSLLSGLAKPTQGSIYYHEQDIQEVNAYQYRREYIGVIFQSFNLLYHLTAIENVVLSMEVSNKKIENKQKRAEALLESVGLDSVTAHRKILELSGGEQQRVAIARAVAYHPHVILADEPTGNLDAETEDEIMKIFQQLAHEEKKCVIIVTHSQKVAEKSDIVYRLQKQS